MKRSDGSVLEELGVGSREEAVRFLKRLWLAEPTDCPRCGTELVTMHRKAKKSVCDWKCPQCGAVYKTIRLLDRLNGEDV